MYIIKNIIINHKNYLIYIERMSANMDIEMSLKDGVGMEVHFKGNAGLIISSRVKGATSEDTLDDLVQRMAKEEIRVDNEAARYLKRGTIVTRPSNLYVKVTTNCNTYLERLLSVSKETTLTEIVRKVFNQCSARRALGCIDARKATVLHVFLEDVFVIVTNKPGEVVK